MAWATPFAVPGTCQIRQVIPGGYTCSGSKRSGVNTATRYRAVLGWRAITSGGPLNLPRHPPHNDLNASGSQEAGESPPAGCKIAYAGLYSG